MTKVYMKIKGNVFECLPSQTELEYEKLGHGSLVDPCGTYTVSSFKAAITTEQPWSCKVQNMWNKLPKKRRTIYLVMVTDNNATEWVFKDVDITFISDILDESFTERDGFARPLIPVIKGETHSEVKTIVRTHAWWQQ